MVNWNDDRRTPRRSGQWSAFVLAMMVLILLALCAEPARSDDTVPLPTMSATAWRATPTPIVAAPVIYTSFVFLPVVANGGE